MIQKKLVASNRVQAYGSGVGGYLLEWGTVDINGVAWVRETNFHEDWYGQHPILFSHGQNDDVGLQQLGTIYRVEKTDTGLLIMGMLDPTNEWYEPVGVLLDRDSLIWGASPVQHLAKAVGGVWVDYPIAEFSVKNANPESLEEFVK